MLKSKYQILEKITFVGACLLLLAPFYVLPRVLYPDVLGKAVIIQIIIALLLPALGAVFFWRRRERIIRNNPVAAALLIFVAVLAITAITGIDFYQSFWGSDNRVLGLFNFFHYLAAYFIFFFAFSRSVAAKKQLLLLAVAVGVLMAMLGIGEYARTGGSRVGGTLGNPIFYGGYLLFPLFISAKLFLSARKRNRFLFLASSILIFVALLFAQSRGAFFGFLAGALFTLVSFTILQPKERRKSAVLKIGSIVAAMLMLVIILYAAGNQTTINTVRRFTNLGLQEASSNQRLLIYGTALRAFGERPALGWGWENFDYAFDKEYDPALLKFGVSETWSDRSHNTYLDMLVMGGVLGFLAYLGIFVAAILAIIKSVKNKNQSKNEGAILASLLAAYAAQNFFAFDSPTSLIYLMFVLAYISSAYALPAGGETEKQAEPKGGYYPGLILGCLLAVLAIAPTLANARAAKRMFAFELLPPLAAREGLVLFEQASGFKPSLIRDFRLRLANKVFEDADSMTKEDARVLLDRAILEMKQNINEAPNDFAYRYELGNLYLERAILFGPEDLNAAEEAYAAAEPYSPRRQALFFQLASVKYLKRQIGEAVSLLEKAISFNPDIGQARWRLGIAYAYNGENGKALREWRQALLGKELKTIDYDLIDGVLVDKDKFNYLPLLSKERKFAADLAAQERDYELLRVLLLADIKLEDDDVNYFGQLAVVELELGEFGKARKAAAEAVRLDSSYAAEAQAFLEEISRRENEKLNNNNE
ncbi:O-antigen ligase family protein [Candidatus Uhrbacteria bacterium]|nr:O-antigen ligase family protein [Candidatus Uhrbacteria bacterium]